jgi:hypothetical protein
VLSFGGFLGLGQSYHPIPFSLLSVNQEKGGYIVNADRSLLDGSPSYRPNRPRLGPRLCQAHLGLLRRATAGLSLFLAIPLAPVLC